MVRRRVEEMVRGEPTLVDRWCLNFLNFEIDNFKVREKGSLRDVVEEENANFDITQAPNNDEITV